MPNPDKAELQAVVLEKRVSALERVCAEMEKAARAAGDTAKKLNAMELEAKAVKDKVLAMSAITKEGAVIQKSFKDRQIQLEAEYKKKQAEAAAAHQEFAKKDQALTAQAAKTAKHEAEFVKISAHEQRLEQRLAGIEMQLKTLTPVAHKAAADAAQALGMAISALKH